MCIYMYTDVHAAALWRMDGGKERRQLRESYVSIIERRGHGVWIRTVGEFERYQDVVIGWWGTEENRGK